MAAHHRQHTVNESMDPDIPDISMLRRWLLIAATGCCSCVAAIIVDHCEKIRLRMR